MIMRRYIIIILLSLISSVLNSQAVVTGLVADSETGKAIPDVAVVIDSNSGVSTASDGTFKLNVSSGVSHLLEAKMVGYKVWRDTVSLKPSDTIHIEVLLQPDLVESEEVVVSATKTENFINAIPTRVSIITPRLLKAIPALSVDDYLANVPGLNISRSFGIFSHKATITMRGLSGNEQARVLVMIDGVPVNKSDGGSVNWNLLDPDMIDRIEVVKGPVSSVYGSNAMGGAVNILTLKPADGFSGSVKSGYGTYNTFTGRINLSEKLLLGGDRSFYWTINGFYRRSDGYITQSEADQAASPYIVPSDVKEYSGELKFGYSLSRKESIDLDLIYYDDDRGTGEKVYQPEGNTVDHDTYQARVSYRRDDGRLTSAISLFWLKEDYKKVNDYIKDDYTFYKVFSGRLDAGMLSSFTYLAGSAHKISAGLDLKQGSVDARDVYYTSTDIVYNSGKMFNAGLFAQDEVSLADERLKIVMGMRYDLALFYDGSFTIEAPSAETSFMYDLQNNSLDRVLWNSVTPKLSVNYTPSSRSRIYLSAGRGFRPSVLDDLCRSGRIKGGFKLANPHIDPEYLTNFEVGGDMLLSGKIRASASLYYSVGKDFMYYINSGDSIDMGFGERPVLLRTNIPRVDIYGAEMEVNYRITEKITFNAAYSYTFSEIISYRKLDREDTSDLTGNHLTDVQASTFSLSGRWHNPVADLSLQFRYHGTAWVNDQNIYDEIVGDEIYPAYATVDARVSKEISLLRFDLGVQNILDNKYFDSKGAVCPGRFITFDVKVSF